MLIVLVVLLGAGAYWGYLRYWEEPAQGLEASGTIEATQVQLTAKLPGTLQNFTIKAGDPVKKGQLVATLERNDLVAQRERDALAVMMARAKLDELLSGARQQEILGNRNYRHHGPAPARAGSQGLRKGCSPL